MSGRGGGKAKGMWGWVEETRRTGKECESVDRDYLKVKISLWLPSQRSKEPHSRTQSEPLEMKRRMQYTNGGGSVDPAKRKDRSREAEGKDEETERDERKKRETSARPTATAKQQPRRLKIQSRPV